MTESAGPPPLTAAARDRIQEFCPMCGYSMTGNTTGTCPECGYALPKDLLVLSARDPVTISLAHLIALPLTLGFWMVFLPLIFLFAPENTPDAVLIPICIVYIVTLFPLFFVMTRLVYRLTPIKRRFPFVFVANANGYGFCSRRGIGPELMDAWSRQFQLRCKVRDRDVVLIECGTPLWLDISLRTEVQVSRDRAADLADQIRDWIESAVEPDPSPIEFGDDED